jgi:hypothetical protein
MQKFFLAPSSLLCLRLLTWTAVLCHRCRLAVVPEGYFLKSPGQTAPCSRGEWKAGFGIVASCTRCSEGVTTPAEGATAEAACTVVMPSFYPSTVEGGVVKAAQKCPQKFW